MALDSSVGSGQRSQKVEAYIEGLQPEVAEIVRTLRNLILGSIPDVEEDIKWEMPCYSKNGLLCYISPAENCVSLGFYRDAELRAPEGLLEGHGKRLRHVRVRSLGKIDTDLLRQLLLQAVEVNRGRP